MMGKIKSGKEMLDDFFNNPNSFKGVDSSISEMLVELYQDGNLTDTNIKNKLEGLRNENIHEN